MTGAIDASADPAAAPDPSAVPVPVLFEAVVGQPKAVAQLTAAARRPVHAYLLHGPPGSGKRAGARGLAAALLARGAGAGSATHAGGLWPGPIRIWSWWSAPVPLSTSTRPGPS